MLKTFALSLCLIALIAFTMVGCASVPKPGAQDDGSFVYHLTPEQVAQCEKEGGCSTVTLEYERDLVRQSAKHFCGVDI
jgi:uncharacterized protein YceK